MDLSFVILTWNSERYLRKCFSSIAESMQGSGLSYEVLVLDNGSVDGSPALLTELASNPDTHLFPHFESTNLGTTRSRNILLKRARGEYVCVMDSDVELAPGALAKLIPELGRSAGVGMVVPRIVYPSGRWQKSIDVFPTLFDKVNRFVRLRSIEARQGRALQDAATPFTVDYAISAFWLMRRSVLEEVGLLDENIFYAPEDVDFCLRVWRAGHAILYVPSVTVVHHTQEISRGFKLNKAKIEHMKGLAYFFMKHRYLFRRPRFAVAPGLAATDARRLAGNS